MDINTVHAITVITVLDGSNAKYANSLFAKAALVLRKRIVINDIATPISEVIAYLEKTDAIIPAKGTPIILLTAAAKSIRKM